MILLSMILASTAPTFHVPDGYSIGKYLCRAPDFVSHVESTEVTDMDRNMLLQAINGCPQRYPNSPCVVKFEKVGPEDYKVTCGAAVGEK